MKNLIICVVLGAILFTVLLFSCGCTKQYSENPTCRRYLELIDKFDGEMIYLRTDTLYPNGRISNYACDSELMKLINYQPKIEGCENGWQKVYYKII
jgi:hypothetical protein